MHLFKDLSHPCYAKPPNTPLYGDISSLVIQQLFTNLPSVTAYTRDKVLMFQKASKERRPQTLEIGAVLSLQDREVGCYERVRLLAVLTFKFMIYFNFSYNEHLKPQKYLRKHECLEKPKIWLPVKLYWWMKTFGRGDNFLFEDWYFKSSCANFSEELRWSMTYGDHMSRLVRDSPGLHLLSLPHY